MTEVVWFAFIAFSQGARTVAYPAMARFRYSLAFNPAFSVARASVELEAHTAVRGRPGKSACCSVMTEGVLC